jgi:hypothetical protein
LVSDDVDAVEWEQVYDCMSMNDAWERLSWAELSVLCSSIALHDTSQLNNHSIKYYQKYDGDHSLSTYKTTKKKWNTDTMDEQNKFSQNEVLSNDVDKVRQLQGRDERGCLLILILRASATVRSDRTTLSTSAAGRSVSCGSATGRTVGWERRRRRPSPPGARASQPRGDRRRAPAR